MNVPITSDFDGYQRFWDEHLREVYREAYVFAIFGCATFVTFGLGVLAFLWKIERNTRREREASDRGPS